MILSLQHSALPHKEYMFSALHRYPFVDMVVRFALFPSRLSLFPWFVAIVEVDKDSCRNPDSLRSALSLMLA